jgi:hydroxymethylpyrimidine/phosphomethylpyrimidine kinase
MKRKIALSIAGSDPSGGAGVQADLKSFDVLDVHGATAITCITVQNTRGVKTIYKLPVDLIKNQIDVLYEDMRPDAVKTGMIYDEEIINGVAKKITEYNMKTVVDPVMISTSGDSLVTSTFIETLTKKIIPQAYVVTPNLIEARILSGEHLPETSKLDDIKKACEKIQSLGAQHVLIKGGHRRGEYVQDVLFDGDCFTVFSLPRIPNGEVHGSGCTLSALIAGFIALGEKPAAGIEKAKHILWNMMNERYQPGVGNAVLNHAIGRTIEIPSCFPSNEHFIIWYDLKTSVDELLLFLPARYVPEVGINVGYALPSAKNIEDICAINGRIIKMGMTLRRCGGYAFNTSNHIARIILTAMRYDPTVRSAMNIKYSSEIIKKSKKLRFKIGLFDREQEPAGETSTMEWGTNKVIQELGFVPDIIYDLGKVGKEPMIRLLGENPQKVVEKAGMLLKTR